MTIDWWTLALQTVNFLVLVWILARFFFGPIRQIMAARQAAAAKVLTDAEAAQRAADEALADARKSRAALEADRDRLVAEAKTEAGEERDRMLAAAKAEADRMIADAKTAGEREHAAMEEAQIQRLRELSVAIAGRLLARLPAAQARDVFLDALVKKIAGLAPEMRTAFLSADGPIEVVTEEALDGAGRARVENAVTTAFGAPVTLTFRADPAILAGIELNAPHAFIRSSWREDLDRIRDELSRDHATTE